ncbi:gliding motility-associated C-terminal domain-containing protein [Bernardetia sp. OM2101]|uniref:T9SS type B sorting domain-containing protein n=1 Tax=Bernardetia sp. OM2101 TaxID=3344876 RepID=UPI0035D10D2C
MDLKNKKYLSSSFLIIVLTLFLFLFQQENIFAQTPCFDVSNVKGCAPLTVNVTDCSGADPNLVFYRFGGARVQQETIFTFQQPGIYSISQLINTGGAGGDSVRQENIIEVFAPKVVDFDVIRCIDTKVRVQINEDYYDSYKIDFGDNQSVTVGDNEFADHTYTSLNNFTITVRGLFTDGAENCTPSSEIITPLGELLPPTVTRFESFENGSATIEYILRTDLPHNLEIMTGNSFEIINAIPLGSTSFTIQNISPNAVYRISVQDVCSNQTESSSLFYAADVFLRGEENYIDINWTRVTAIDDTEFVKYRLYKLSKDGNVIYDSTDVNFTTISDEDIACKVTYCYQLETEFVSGLQIISPKRCILAASNALPPPVFDVYASFTPTGQTVFSWSYPVGLLGAVVTGAKITRKNDAGIENVYTVNSADSIFEDRAVDIEAAPYCYSISYTNACDLTSEPSPFICPIIIRMEGNTSEKEGTLYFDWTAFEGEVTSNYTFEQTDSIGKQPFNIQSVSSSGTYSIDIGSQLNQTSYIRIRADLGDSVTYSNTIRIDFNSFINFPNVFTPNGDNLNDTYGVESKFIKKFDMIIFNKWGEGVFQTNNIGQRWDGRYRNGLAPSGEYTVKIVATDQRNRKYVFTEMVKLMR